MPEVRGFGEKLTDPVNFCDFPNLFHLDIGNLRSEQVAEPESTHAVKRVRNSWAWKLEQRPKPEGAAANWSHRFYSTRS